MTHNKNTLQQKEKLPKQNTEVGGSELQEELRHQILKDKTVEQLLQPACFPPLSTEGANERAPSPERASEDIGKYVAKTI